LKFTHPIPVCPRPRQRLRLGQVDPDAEAAETKAKVSGVVTAMATPTRTVGAREVEPGSPRGLAADPAVRQALRQRNSKLNPFWLTAADRPRTGRNMDLSGRKMVMVDAEDAFTTMLAQHITALGVRVDSVPYDCAEPLPAADLVLLGPGPGDPTDTGDPKIEQCPASPIGCSRPARRFSPSASAISC
jgi:phenazine biosynthesis protein phzE